MGLPREIEERWTSGVVLKRDLLSTVERGRFGTRAGDVEAVLRRIDEVPWWSFGVARHLFARERRALAIAGELGIAPPLLFAGRDALIRGWIDGLPLHIAKPRGERSFFRSAKVALRKLHRAGICHNDLAKEQNWLRGRDGPISPISSLPLTSRAAPGFSASRLTRTCGTCSSTSGAMRPTRSPPPSDACSRRRAF
jgi:hypothetical protein